jgi:hypothetical protein
MEQGNIEPVVDVAAGAHFACLVNEKILAQTGDSQMSIYQPRPDPRGNVTQIKMANLLSQPVDDLFVVIVHGASFDNPGAEVFSNVLLQIRASVQRLRALDQQGGKGHAGRDAAVTAVCPGQDFVYLQRIFKLGHGFRPR